MILRFRDAFVHFLSRSTSGLSCSVELVSLTRWPFDTPETLRTAAVSLNRVPLLVLFDDASSSPPDRDRPRTRSPAGRRSRLLFQRGSTLADFLEHHFKATKLLQA